MGTGTRARCYLAREEWGRAALKGIGGQCWVCGRGTPGRRRLPLLALRLKNIGAVSVVRRAVGKVVRSLKALAAMYTKPCRTCGSKMGGLVGEGPCWEGVTWANSGAAAVGSLARKRSLLQHCQGNHWVVKGACPALDVLGELRSLAGQPGRSGGWTMPLPGPQSKKSSTCTRACHTAARVERGSSSTQGGLQSTSTRPAAVGPISQDGF